MKSHDYEVSNYEGEVMIKDIDDSGRRRVIVRVYDWSGDPRSRPLRATIRAYHIVESLLFYEWIDSHPHLYRFLRFFVRKVYKE